MPQFETRRTGSPSQRQLRVGELARHAFADVLARHSGAGLDGVPVTTRGEHVARPEARDRARAAACGGRKPEKLVEALNKHTAICAAKCRWPHVSIKPMPELRFDRSTPPSRTTRGSSDLLKSPKVRPRPRTINAPDGAASGKDRTMGRSDKGSTRRRLAGLDKPVGMTSTEAVAG